MIVNGNIRRSPIDTGMATTLTSTTMHTVDGLSVGVGHTAVGLRHYHH